MATITANGSKGHHKFTLEVTEASYSVNNNTSDVSFTFKIAPITSGYNWSGWGSYISYTITIDGTNYTGTIGSYNGSSTVTLKSDSKTGILHNNDGTKTINFSFSVADTSGQTYTCGNASASGSLSLTTIPRASSITVADANIGSSTNITINKNSSSFTTTLYYKASGQNSWTKIVDKTANQVYGWTVPTSFYALIPNTKKITCQFYADTYNGSSLVGTSSTVTATFTATGNPVINSFTLVDTNSTTTALTGDSAKMVRYASNVKATISASGQNSATISSIKVNGTTATNGVVTINGATTNSFTVEVTDSRSYSTTQTKTMTMVNYVALTLNATVTRNQPTDGKVNIVISGNYFNGSFGSQSNTLTTQYRYKERSSATWENWTNLSVTVSGNTYSGNTQLSNMDYTKIYDFEVRALDKVYPNGEKTITGITVSKGTPVFNWDDDEFRVNTNLVIPKANGTGITDTSNNAILYALSNNNTVLNASGSILFLGYQNTNSLNFLNKKGIMDSDGNLSLQGGEYASYIRSKNIVTDLIYNAIGQSGITYSTTSFTTNSGNYSVTVNSQGKAWAWVQFVLKDVPTNTQLTFSCNYSAGGNANTNAGIYDNNDTSLKSSTYTTATSGKITLSFTTTTSTIKLRFSANSSGSALTNSVTFSNIMIEKGSTATSYYANEDYAMNKYLKNVYIGTGINLNDFKKSGHYGIYGTNTNGPTTSIGVLEVLNYSNDWVIQKFSKVGTENEVWERCYHSGTTWSSWKKVGCNLEGNITCTKSSGNSNMTSAYYYQDGNVVTLHFTFKTTAQVNVGANAWAGTISGPPRPKRRVTGTGYFGSSAISAGVYGSTEENTGLLNIRILGANIGASNECFVSVTYVTN